MKPIHDIRINGNNFMTQEWKNLSLDDKFKRAKELIAKIANNFAEDPDQNILVLKSILCNVIENLFYYINNPQDENIDWENPAVDLHYSVDINENLQPIYFKLDENDVQTRDKLDEKLISSFVDLHNILLFESLCKETIISKQNGNYSYLINSEKINNEITHIINQDDKLNKIIELTHNKIDLPFELNKFNDEKSLIQEISCNLIIEFTPLIVDIEQHTGHYSVIVSLISAQSLSNFSNEEKSSIKEKLIESIRKNASNLDIDKNKLSEVPEDFIEMGFNGKLLIDKSLKPNFIGGDTLQICLKNLPEYDKSPKKLIFSKPRVNLTEEEEKILYLYVIEGVENYSKIAEKMFCSEQTVKNRIQSIKDKLGATHMANAAYLYYMPPMQDLA